MEHIDSRRDLNGISLLKQGVQYFKQRGHEANLRNERDHEQEQNQGLTIAIDTALLSEIKAEADIFLQQPIPELPMEIFNLFKEKGSRKEYENLYFARRKRLTALGLMAIIEPDERSYTTALEEIIAAVCQEFTWCLPAHYTDEQSIDLFAAETAFTLAELAELLEDKLSRQLQANVKEEVFRRVLEPFMSSSSIWWEQVEHNWASVCAGSIGSAAIYYMNDSDQRLQPLLERVVKAMESYLQGFQQDGACAEGYAYWQYGFGYFVYFADLLYAYTQGRTNLLAVDKVKQIALFQQKCFLAGKNIVNFSDSPPTAGVFMGLTHYLHDLYEEVHIPPAACRAAFAEDHCGRWAPALRNLLWLKHGSGAEWQAASYPLEQAQWLISRVQTSAGSAVFAAKGGHNDEPHNHNDLGHFILAANGKSLLLDLGSGLYTKEYFNEQRYSYMCTSSAGHSVPIIGGEQQTAGEQAKTELLALNVEEHKDVMSLELAAAYESKHLQQFTRTFTWNKATGGLMLEDDIAFTEQAEAIVERFIVINDPSVVADNCLAVTYEGETVYIQFDAEAMEWHAEKFHYFDHFAQQTTRYYIDFEVKQPQLRQQLMFQFSLKSSTT